MPIKGRKVQAAHVAPRPTQHCHCASCGEGCTPRALAEGLLMSLCAKALGTSPYRPRNDKRGLICSSHRCVLYFEISCQKAALLSPPMSLWAWCGRAGTAAHWHWLYLDVQGDDFYGYSYRSSTASAQPSVSCKWPCFPFHTFKRGKIGVGGEHCFAQSSCACQLGPSLTIICWMLTTAFSRVCTAPSPVLCRWHSSFLADVLLKRRNANSENPTSSPCCRSHRSLRDANVFFQAMKRKRGFVKKA